MLALVCFTNSFLALDLTALWVGRGLLWGARAATGKPQPQRHAPDALDLSAQEWRGPDGAGPVPTNRFFHRVIRGAPVLPAVYPVTCSR